MPDIFNARQHNYQRAAVRMAAEILIHIFSHLISWPIEEDENGANLVAASQVCTIWREVAIGCPLLWTFIGPTMSLPRIQDFLSRSGSAQLDAVSLNLRARSQAEAALERVFLETHRTHTLRLVTNLPTYLAVLEDPVMRPVGLHRILLHKLPDLVAYSLHAFSLCYRTGPESPHTFGAEYALCLPDRVFRGESPNLRHLVVHSPFYILPTSTLLSTVTSLEFTGIHDMLLTALILNSPNVERVKAEIESDFEWCLKEPISVSHRVDTLPSLHSLEITGMGICPLRVFHLLERTPQLRHLHVKFDYESEVDLDLHPAAVSLPHLESVKLVRVVEEALPLLSPLTPWRAAQNVSRIDLHIKLDWYLSDEDCSLLKSLFDTIPHDDTFEVVQITIDPHHMVSISAGPASSLRGDLARNPLAAHDAWLVQLTLVYDPIQGNIRIPNQSIPGLVERLLSPHSELTTHLVLTRLAPKRRKQRPSCDTVEEWRELLRIFPNVEVLAVDVPDTERFLEALLPPLGDHQPAQCGVVPSLSKLIFLPRMNDGVDAWPDVNAPSLVDQGRLGFLIDVLRTRRHSHGGRVLSSVSFALSEGYGRFLPCFPLEEKEMRAMKAEASLVMTLELDDSSGTVETVVKEL